MGAYDRLQPGLFIMRQGDRESKWHGHGPAPEYKGETAIHAMTMPPFYIIAQLKYTGTGFTKQTSSFNIGIHVAHWCFYDPHMQACAVSHNCVSGEFLVLAPCLTRPPVCRHVTSMLKGADMRCAGGVVARGFSG